MITGIISLINMQNFAERPTNVLNISVTDGVYTSFTRVKIQILPANRNNPVFPQLQIDVKVAENQPHGTVVTQVTASDKDFGIYGDIAYSIPSELLRETFEIDKRTGNFGTCLFYFILFYFILFFVCVYISHICLSLKCPVLTILTYSLPNSTIESLCLVWSWVCPGYRSSHYSTLIM
jgi:hypothetical protein